MTRHGYECPDCEQPSCPGYGCIGGISIERHPFARIDVCRVKLEPDPEPKLPAAPKTKPNRLTQRDCIICGAGFMPKRHHAKTCGQACRVENQSRIRKVAVKPRPCVVCSEVFTPRASNGTTCGKDCRREVQNERVRQSKAKRSLEQRAAEQKRDNARRRERRAKAVAS